MHCFIASEKNYGEQTLAQQSEIEKEVWFLLVQIYVCQYYEIAKSNMLTK